MTTFAANQLDPAIANTAQLLAYAVLLNKRMYKAVTYNEVEGQAPAPIITGNIITTDDSNYPDRLMGRFSIPLIQTWAEDSTSKLYLLCNSMGSVAQIPAEYDFSA